MDMLQECLFSDNPEYDAFLEKFKPKKTTDDCYTPPLVYEAVKKWACREYGIDPERIVRPFYPGGDYEGFDYSAGKVVLDNPPFSILSKICGFYLDRDIPFFLFAPGLTAFSGKSVAIRMNHIFCDAEIVYENGAVVRTAFVTSYGGDEVARTAPDLGHAIKQAVDVIRRETVRTVPKYTYPDHVLTASMLHRYSKYGINFSVRRGQCRFISKLDTQAEKGKSIYGGGLLLSNSAAAERAAAERAAAERAAAERAAAERAAAHVWNLSDRERRLVDEIGGQGP